MAESSDLQGILKPFYQRASEAEERLTRLEAASASKRYSGSEELPKMVKELQSKLEDVKAAHAAEREMVQQELQQLNAENAKLQYRITHLVRALKEVNCKLTPK